MRRGSRACFQLNTVSMRLYRGHARSVYTVFAVPYGLRFGGIGSDKNHLKGWWCVLVTSLGFVPYAALRALRIAYRDCTTNGGATWGGIYRRYRHDGSICGSGCGFVF